MSQVMTEPLCEPDIVENGLEVLKKLEEKVGAWCVREVGPGKRKLRV